MALDRMKDKVAIVTGAAPRGDGLGNGMACAMMFAQEGAKVVLVNRKREKADALAEKIRADGGEAHVITCDVTDKDQVEAMVAETMDKYGRLDVLHNNAGIGGGGGLEKTDLPGWHKVIGLNMTGVMLCCQAAVPAMRTGGRGGARLHRDQGGAARHHHVGRSRLCPRADQSQHVGRRLGLHADGGASGRGGAAAAGQDGAATERGYRLGCGLRRHVPRQRRIPLDHRHRVAGRWRLVVDEHLARRAQMKVSNRRGVSTIIRVISASVKRRRRISGSTLRKM